MCAEKGQDADADDGEGRMHRRHDEPRRPVSYIHKLPIVRPWRLLLVLIIIIRIIIIIIIIIIILVIVIIIAIVIVMRLEA